MKMARGINLHFRSGKYSNAAESYATQMSAENRAYTIRNILTEAAEFRSTCQTRQFERTMCPAGLILAAGKFCLEDQGLFVACTLARSHWSTRSHRRVFDSVFKSQTRKYTLTVKQNYSERN